MSGVAREELVGLRQASKQFDRDCEEACASPRSCSDPGSPLDSALLLVRRAHAFVGNANAAGLAEKVQTSQFPGLSQDILDTLSVESSCCHLATDECEGDNALLRVKRMRAFMGSSRAAAMAAAIKAKVAQDEATISTCSVRSSPRSSQPSPSGGCLSRCGAGGAPSSLLGGVLPCVDEGRQSRSVGGGSTVSHEAEQRRRVADVSSAVPPVDQEDLLYHLRRVRFFMGAEQAEALAAAAMAEASGALEDGVHAGMSEACSKLRGKTQRELDRLCVEPPADDCSSLSCGGGSGVIQVEKMATPQRKWRLSSRRASSDLEQSVE